MFRITITTHQGILKFNWLAFGIKVASAIFQQVIDTMLNGLDFAFGNLDNILPKSETPGEHKKIFSDGFRTVDSS